MYNVNKTLLQLLIQRENWLRLKGSIKTSRFDKEIRVVLNQINKHWALYETEELNFEVFCNKFYIDVPCTDEERGFYDKIFEVMQDEPDTVVSKDIIRDLRTMEFQEVVDEASNDFAIGKDIDLYETVRSHVNNFERDIRRDSNTGYCTDTIQDIVQGEEQGIVMNWHLDCLKASMPNMQTGTQVIVAARPGKGKTSFVAHAVSNFLNNDNFRQHNRPIVWMNNEGYKSKIKGTCIRAALNKSFPEIKEMGWDVANAEASRLIPDNLLRVYDVHGRDYLYLERIIENDKPLVVVWDMLDNVKGAFMGKGVDRRDQQLEMLYQWARECSVKYNFLSIPTSQISVEGSDTQWVSDSCLKDSKTAKQGACDAIITIGHVNKIGFENSRFIFVPKTKSIPVGSAYADCRTEVVFDGARSRYLNPKKEAKIGLL